MSRIEKLKSFLAETPDDSFVQHALALEYIKLNNDAEAEKLFIHLLSNDPGYVGSYYHLAKLLERKGMDDEAVTWYEKGMQEAKKAGNRHAYNELQSALDELQF